MESSISATSCNHFESQAYWYGPSLAKKQNLWRFSITEDSIEILSKVADDILQLSEKSISSSGMIDITTIQDCKSELLIPLQDTSLWKLLHDINHELINGIGFAVLSALPVTTWSLAKSAAAFVAISLMMGDLRMQNKDGHVLGHVKDMGLSSDDPNVRIYQTKERQTFHTDSCDIVGLLCIQPAKVGGISSVVSVETIVHEMIKRNRIDLIEELQKPFPQDRRGDIPDGCLPYFLLPVLHIHDSKLSVIYQRQYIDSSQRFYDAPRLTDKQIEALNSFDTLADDPNLHLDMELQPGDLQFVHNHNMLHDRSSFIDYHKLEKKRHLLRVWICPPFGRELPNCYLERYDKIGIGNRGGIRINDTISPIAPINI